MKTYFIYVDTGFTIDGDKAKDEDEAREIARQWFIKHLNWDTVEFLVEVSET